MYSVMIRCMYTLQNDSHKQCELVYPQPHIITSLLLVVVVRTLKLYAHSNFQADNTVLLL